MRHLLFFVSTAILLLVSGLETKASHALGAEITYECLGGNQYRIRLVFYRDCAGISAPTSPVVNITGCGNQNVTMTLQPATQYGPPFSGYLAPYELPVYCAASNCSNGSNPGIQEYVYTAVVTLNPCANWTISYDLCCRSAAINTISGPGNQDIFVSAFLNNLAAPCNNSPQFDFPARGFLCINQLNQIVATATDPDGDVLVYSLYTPWHDPGSSVTYTGGYNPNNPLNNTQYTFNNGVIDVFPTTQQITVIGVMVEEYRNGVLIGRIVRDMQVRVVTNCPQNPGSTWDTNGDGVMDPVEYVICAGSTVNIDIFINNTVPGKIYTLNMDNTADFAGATFNTTPDPANPNSVVGHFTWTPSAADLGQTFSLLFTAFDNNCPIVGYSNFVYQMTLTGLDLQVAIDTVAISCTDSTQITALVNNGSAPYSYLWNNGATTNTRYVTAGQHWIQVTDAMGCTGSDTIDVYYIDDPVAQFQPQNGCTSTALQFTDLSTNNVPVGWNPIPIVDWNWDFGDGTSASGIQNPTHSYTQEGDFTAQLVVTNQLGCRDTIIMDLRVNPRAEVNFSKSNECLGTPINFNDQSTVASGNIISWTYNFGDGSPTQNIQNTSYQYANPGWYNVTLSTVTDSGCTSSATLPVYVDPIPVAAFTPTDVCLNNASNFTDLSTVSPGTIGGWAWDFGDGNTATTANPVHTFTLDGVFNVSLTVTSDSGCTNAITQAVTVHPALTAAFTHQAECAMVASQFTDQSTVSSGSVVSWNWYFGDGSTSNLQNPTHPYAVGGPYTASLAVVSDMGCRDSVSVMTAAYPKPDAAFNGFNACLGNANTFDDQSLVAAGSAVVQWEWDFGDGGLSNMQSPQHTYATTGTKTVTLMVETNSGCRDTTTSTVEVYVLPTAAFSFSDICLYEAAVFTNNSSLSQGSIVQNQWLFGNGNSFVGTQPPGQMYPTAGAYDVRLVVRSNNACRDTLIQTINVFPVPVAYFGYDTVCAPNTTSFTDLTTLNGANMGQWDWDFGDGSIHGNTANPTHTYNTFGYYYPTLSITSTNGCMSDTTLGPVIVHPKPQADFSNLLANCFGLSTPFIDESSISNIPVDVIDTWSWDFADGNTDTLQNTAHIFGSAGFYSVQLAIESNHGCQDTVIRVVEIYPLPTVNFAADTTRGCQPFTASFSDLSTIPSPYALSSWEWNFGAGGDAISSQFPSHTYYDPTIGLFDSLMYSVSLTVTSGNGCVDSLTIADYITEYPKPNALFTVTPEVVSILDPRVFFTDMSSANVSAWDWRFGDGGTSALRHPVHTYPDTLGYQIVEIVETNMGCRDTAVYRIKVEPNFTFWVPSSFTPNNDGINETFFGNGIGIKQYAMYIYDRWGELIFESYQREHQWDGSYKNRQVQQGVYIYVFDVVDIFGNPHRFRGDVTLMR